MPHKAVFLDRDGTIIDDSGYLSDPAGVHLLPGVDLAIKSLRSAGYKIVVVTNQSGVARGMLTEAALEEIHSTLRNQLAEKGAVLDAIYYCPYHPDGSVDKYASESDHRKPEPGMLLLAGKELDLDLEQSWMVGDAGRDVGAGQKAGTRTVRIRHHHDDDVMHHGEETLEEFQADFTSRNLVEAAKIILQNQESQSPVEESDEDTPEAVEYEQVEAGDADDETASEADDDDRPVFRVETHARSEQQRKGLRARVTDDSNALQEIHRHVRQIVKREETEEFSALNVLGGVTQVLAVLFLLVVFWKALGHVQIQEATMWGVIAMVFQTMSLTFFTMARRK
ncbi:MAG: HAD family hydrolase [Phycisphaerae bacterium]|nr:HAD family hydrolase [Phycisphaerae bacterium]